MIRRGFVEEVVLRLSQSQHLPSRQCFKRQLVDLVMEGVWQELLDSAQIEIVIADWGAKMEWATESHSEVARAGCRDSSVSPPSAHCVGLPFLGDTAAEIGKGEPCCIPSPFPSVRGVHTSPLTGTTQRQP